MHSITRKLILLQAQYIVKTLSTCIMAKLHLWVMVAKSDSKFVAFVTLEKYAVATLPHDEPVAVILDEMFVIRIAGVSKISIDELMYADLAG